jgi:hypothetical protein
MKKEKTRILQEWKRIRFCNLAEEVIECKTKIPSPSNKKKYVKEKKLRHEIV